MTRRPADGTADLEERLRTLEARLEEQERAMREQDARLQEKTRILTSILESMSDGVAVIDAAGRFLQFNPAASRMIGIGPVDAPPATWPERYGFFMPDMVTRYPADRLPLMRARRGESVDEEMIYTRPPGAAKGTWLSINSRPLKDESGAILGAVSVLRNVTRRITAERALERKAQELARSNAELEQFAYVASHDLQEPLRMIAGYADLLSRRYRDRLDAEANGFLDDIAASTARMTDLIHDILALSRVASSRGPFEPADGDILCERALANLQAAVTREHAVVTHDHLPRVLCDPSQVVQVFQNLIGNAIKYHGEAPPRVHVTAEPKERKAVFTVRDEGIGVEPGSLEEIFQMFRRGDERGPFAGTGVGLAICRKVIERHGGRIWAEPAPGHGTAFRFTLPLADAAGVAPATGAAGGRHAP
jgi:signal transduction histidine kinase